MSNEIQTPEQEPVKRPRRRIVVFALLCLLVLAAIVLFLFRDNLNLDAARRFVSYLNVSSSGEYGEFTYDFSPANAFCPYDGGLAVASATGVVTYSEKGTERQSEQVTLNLPAVQTGGSILLAYDVGGRELRAIHKSKGTVASITAQTAVLDADIAPDGAFCYIDRSDGYKTVLSVWDKNQNLIYRWNSATKYFGCCTLGEGAGLMAGVALGVTNGVYESSILFFDTQKEEPLSETVLGNDLILDVELIGSTACAIGENAIYFVSRDGEIRGVYDISGYILQDYALGGDGFLALRVNKNKAGAPEEILTVDLSGQELGSLTLSGEALSISACGKYLAVLEEDSMTVYTAGLSAYAQTERVGSAMRVLMREDGTALLLEPTAGHLYIP